MNLKTIWIGFTISMILVSCKTYTLVDTSQINQQIQFDISIQNPGEVMEKFYPNASLPSIDLSWKELKKPKQYKVTLIQNVQKDSISITPYLHYELFTTFNGDTWHVDKIKKIICVQLFKLLK